MAFSSSAFSCSSRVAIGLVAVSSLLRQVIIGQRIPRFRGKLMTAGEVDQSAIPPARQTSAKQIRVCSSNVSSVVVNKYYRCRKPFHFSRRPDSDVECRREASRHNHIARSVGQLDSRRQHAHALSQVRDWCASCGRECERKLAHEIANNRSHA